MVRVHVLGGLQQSCDSHAHLTNVAEVNFGG